MSLGRLLVVGGSGFLGRHLIENASSLGWEVHATHFNSPLVPPVAHAYRGDLTDADWLANTVESAQPTHIINAAYTQSGPDVHAVCAQGPALIAELAQRNDARFVHVSTDLVFDGTIGRFYREDDPTSPLSDYGAAKVASEELVAAACPGAAIARTSLIYGSPEAPQESLVRRAHDGEEIAFFTDEWRTPVHVADLASALLTLATGSFSGVVHVAGSERLSRFEFARVVAAALQLDAGRLVGGTQDQAGAPRAADVSLDTGLAQSLDLDLQGPTERLSNGYDF